MFIPNLYAKLERRIGLNQYGKAIYSQPVQIPCGIVRMETMSDPTSVRADSSASRGSAREETVLSRILVPAHIEVTSGDRIRLHNTVMTVQSTWPRFSVAGGLDHYQLDLTINAE